MYSPLLNAVVILSFSMILSCTEKSQARVFDVHLHGDTAPEKKMHNLAVNGVYTIAVSTSWPQQLNFKTDNELTVLRGLFVPCPNGIVPYSKQQCFENGKEWPDITWVEQQIKEKKIDFIGEVLTQYY